MTTPDVVAARAALDAARVVFGPVTDGRAQGSASARAEAMWRAAAGVLHAASGRPDLDGQLLIGEARRQDRLALDAAYPLVALHAWAERVHDAPADAQFARDAQPAPGTQERQIAADAIRVLEQMVTASEQTVVRAPPAPPVMPPPRASYAPPAVGMREEIAAPSSHRRVFRSAGFILSAVVLLLVGAAGAWYAFRARAVSEDFEAGLAAYQRGTPEVARIAFAKAARATPDDERPLIFLGRLAREEGNLPSARRFLDAAIRLAPASAVANRELAAVLLADGNPELARRFYVRAVQLDPNDRLAQGFLACALHRLGRADEAKRWLDRAGTGDWSACLTAPAPTSASPSASPAPSPTTAR